MTFIYNRRATNNNCELNRIKNLEEEQEMLSSSLIALTSHFAQVQLRLKQIVAAPIDERDKLLQNLDEFAFRGIPEVTNLSVADQEHLLNAVEQQRNNQFEMIEQLKQKLMEVEKFAYESGANVLPQSILVEKQKVIIDELKNKVNLNVCDDDLPQLSSEDLRNQVDCALGEFVGPVKMKDTLVGQLKTQIVDLERFVAYLQCETNDLMKMTKTMAKNKNPEMVYSTYNSKMAKNRRQSKFGSTPAASATPSMTTSSSSSSSTTFGKCKQKTVNTTTTNFTAATNNTTENLANKAANLLDKASSILSMFAATQLGCGSDRFRKNTLKKTSKGNHWGDLRAQLEVDVQEIVSLMQTIPLAKRKQRKMPSNNISSDSDDDDDDENIVIDSTQTTTAITLCSSNNNSTNKNQQQNNDDTYTTIQFEITRMIRKHFAVTLQKLMQHGLHEDILTTNSLVPFMGCFSQGTYTSARNRQSSSASKQSNNSQHSSSDGNYSIDPDADCDEDERQMHVWELILEYYYIKNGEKFNETPARKLSQSFNLDIAGSATSSSNKQSLLSAIGHIISVHAPYKRSYNSHFKALISLGLKYVKQFMRKIICF